VRRAPALLAALAAALLAAGCGSVGLPEGGNTSNGETQFKAKCGSCHTLAAAGTSGTIGPNLDDAFAQSKKNGIGEETIAGVVRDQIAYPITKTSTGAPGMPANLVTGQDADDVATYVASVAASGKAPTPPPTTTGGTTTGGGGGAADGKSVFASAGCGSCHTLAAAGASGTVGPNLDEAKPSKALVVERVTNGKGVMPSFKDQLSPAEIQAVADYVSSVAGG
jgi:cbb3-type cytochrome c oxidase subunit III